MLLTVSIITTAIEPTSKEKIIGSIKFRNNVGKIEIAEI
jgi:hypothetical protein